MVTHRPVEVLLDTDTVQRRVSELAAAICADYAASDAPVFTGILKGCLYFLADLTRQVTLPLELDLMCISSYGSSAESSGRVRILNDAAVRAGDYILYWMQSSHRTEDNPALQYAIERADQAHLPLIVYFGLWQSYPEANLRHFRFMLEGLAEVGHSLESSGIRFVLRIESPERGACALAKNAAVVIVDRGYLWQQQWQRLRW
jgi:hypothetical protein